MGILILMTLVRRVRYADLWCIALVSPGNAENLEGASGDFSCDVKYTGNDFVFLSN